ncbi:hypothetical protein AMR41_30035 [Hapalosiphon sp. MRB220]|nr:hypothetical protein AMR41_30035 [Hapalosiphon sp. MRB220]
MVNSPKNFSEEDIRTKIVANWLANHAFKPADQAREQGISYARLYQDFCEMVLKPNSCSILQTKLQAIGNW